ncbi:hypothetical protein BU15DRAFT_66891 [Melanogaster broomeanus]|nr:hypothetical protein BU15DRAFT_66891 [Melanogaster broomeanus]
MTAHERSGNLNPKPQGTPIPTTVLTVATSDGTLMGHVTKFCSYPHRFHKVIEWAKLIAQCECATKDPFPARSTFLDQSSAEIINEALLECENVPPGYWPNYRKELGVLLWESLMMWHSTLKGKAHEVVTRLYNIGKHHTVAENQAEAETLIKGAVFLRDGIDDKGSTNNMAHPALATLIMEFFYGPASLGTVFPKLRTALDEYIQTGTRQDRPFEYSGYSKVFTGLLDLQWQIDAHEKHAVKTKLLWVACAQGRHYVVLAHAFIQGAMDIPIDTGLKGNKYSYLKVALSLAGAVDNALTFKVIPPSGKGKKRATSHQENGEEMICPDINYKHMQT